MTIRDITWNLNDTTSFRLPIGRSTEDVRITLKGYASHPSLFLSDSEHVGRKVEIVFPEEGITCQFSYGGEGLAQSILGTHIGTKTYEWQSFCPTCKHIGDGRGGWIEVR